MKSQGDDIVDATSFLASVTFEVAGVDGLPVDEVREKLRTHHIVRIKGIFDRSELRNIRSAIASGFTAANDRRHDPLDSDAIRRNFQKLQIGANSGTHPRRTLGRFMRILYNPIFEDDIYGMQRYFVQLARLRNR